jgi:hypothetical protein
LARLTRRCSLPSDPVRAGRRRVDAAGLRVRRRLLSWLVAALACTIGKMTDAAGPGTVRYSARMIPTGLERRVVYKSDPTRKLCLALTVAHGGQLRGLAVDVTPPWKVEEVIARWDGDCEAPASSAPSARASAASGTIRLRAEGDRCLIDLDVTVTFDPKPPHLRAQESMIASGVLIASTRPPCK